MPRYRPGVRCSICKLANRAQVEASLALGLSCHTVAAKFQVGPDALWRHRRSHMDGAHTAALLLGRKAQQVDFDELQRVEADRLLAEVVDQRVRLRAARDLALTFGQGGLPLALAAENSIRSTLELEIRLLAPILARRMQAQDVPARVQRIERLIVDSIDGKLIDTLTADELAPTPPQDFFADEPEPATFIEPEPPPIEPPAPPPIEPEPTPRNVVRLLDNQRSSLSGVQGRLR